MTGTFVKKYYQVFIFVVLLYLNMPTACQKWVWEREAHINWFVVTCEGSTRLELP